MCIRDRHTLGYGELPKFHEISLEINNDTLEEYSNLLTDYLLAFQRNKVAETLFSLEEFLYNVKNDISSVKLFLKDLFLRIKEKVNHTFHSAEIPFPTNSEIIRRIDQSRYLYEIILFISAQTEMIMNATGRPSRDTILRCV